MFKRLFGKKAGGGGTRIGNMIRQIAYNNSGGAYGSDQGGYVNVIVDNDGGGTNSLVVGSVKSW